MYSKENKVDPYIWEVGNQKYHWTSFFKILFIYIVDYVIESGVFERRISEAGVQVQFAENFGFIFISL